jgi:hypothetical protein
MYLNAGVAQSPKRSFAGRLKAFFLKRKVLMYTWLLALPLLHLATDFLHDRVNNYKIFRQVFFHLIQQQPLYVEYRSQYHDVNHYGPVFAFLIAPFAILPDVVGVLLWNMTNAALLLYTITRINVTKQQQNLIIALSTIEMANAMWSTQFNSGVVSMIALSYILVSEGKDFKATCLIMLSAFVKIYGILGLLFFLFSGKKKEFVLGCAFWGIAFLVLPMLATSPSYILHTYQEWFAELSIKNAVNIGLDSSQDASIPGMLRRVLQQPFTASLPFLLVGASLLLAPLARIRQYGSAQFRWYLVASALMFINLFSSGSEHPTYVVAMVGAAIWFSYRIMEGRTAGFKLLIPFVLLFAGLGPTDLFTKEFRVFMINYSLKALPFAIVWVCLLKDLLVKNFAAASAIPDQMKEGAVITVATVKKGYYEQRQSGQAI